ncbi:MAG TPA: pyridoxamine 5'-phosphate oxidase family protein [Rhizobacter sp.]|nr:pyridoxamine 5'-phosphate oxidase family protein [Rhizobacter sp.]
MDNSTRDNTHAGEREVQQRLGVHERSAAAMRQVIRLAMPAQHVELFEKLPTLMVGSLDDKRRPWASVLAGPPGFARAPDDRHLRIAALPQPGDPLALAPGQPLGLLGIEPHTRRRNRMNGSVVALDAQGFTVQVDQSFGNCPRYIQARTPRWVARGAPPPAVPEGGRLSATAQQLVREADTLFIATASPQARAHAGAEGVDVSHRGGRPGFVRVSEDSVGRSLLLIPDYPGNNFFNTLGNLAVNPRAGLLFISHESGGLLHLSGHTELLWGEAGGPREIRFTVEAGVWRPQVLPLAWSAPEFAPQFTA